MSGALFGTKATVTSPTDGKSRIWPVKTMKGTQPYDPDMHRLLAIHNAGFDDAAYWHTMDWQKSIAAGMKEAGLEWSGKYTFVKTTTTWPITHMVAPKDKALSCAQCHTDHGRLEKIDGIYIPAPSFPNRPIRSPPPPLVGSTGTSGRAPSSTG